MSRVETAFTSISWIPSEAMTGLMRLPMDAGIGRYDEPPPDRLDDDLEAFVAAGRCRFANHVTAWAEFDDHGGLVDCGMTGGGLVAPTEVDLRALTLKVPAIAFPEIRSTEEGDGSVTLVQTAGGRTGAPLPRRTGSAGRPRLRSPTAWTTLAVTLRADGTGSGEGRGASAFPRHWFYDADGALVGKSATIDFGEWTGGLHDEDTPWGDRERTLLASTPESELERELSTAIMRGTRRPSIRRFEPGDDLMVEGAPADSLGLLIDGMVEIDVGGRVVAECGPGCVIGERAFLEDGRRTATVRALTPVKFVEATVEAFDRGDLERLRTLHRREHD
ncbi:MAG: cyclic nucleotide-binding domain-containing protein [Actinomycetota bacterium]